MSASPDVGFSTRGASRKHAPSIGPLLQPFMTAPPQMPPALLIAPNVIGTSSASQLPTADYSSLKSRPLPLARQGSQGPAPITLVAGPPVPARPGTQPPMLPPRSKTLPAGPPSAPPKYPPRPLPPKPGDPGPPSTARQRYPPRPLPPRPGDPGALGGPPRPAVPPSDPATGRPLRGPPRPTVPPPDPPTARPLRQPIRPAPPPPIPKRKPHDLVPFDEPATVRRPRNDLSPIPTMSPGIQREYSMYSYDKSLPEVPAPKTPQMKFKPPGASTPRRAITLHPDATGMPNLEKVGLPVRPDAFFSSNRVMSLNVFNFSRFIKSKDITLVIFYDRDDPESKVHEPTISQAACSTKRTNHAYAAVDCSADSKLCKGNKVTETPIVRLYSRATCLGQLETLRTVTSDILRQYVELAPSKYTSRMVSCPLIKDEQEPE